MRIGIVSDIHGNITGMNAVLAKIDELGGVDKLVVAGDIVTASSGNSDLLKLLISNSAELIKGNIEDFLSNPETNIKKVSPAFRNYIRAWYDWLSKRLTKKEWSTLIKTPLFRRYRFDNGKTMIICHATPDSPWSRTCSSDNSIEFLQEAYGNNDEDIIVYGHWHENHVINLGDKTLVNVASVGLRKDGRTCFTIISDYNNDIQIKQYSGPYDTEKEERLNIECEIPVYEDLVKR